ncbi:efflux RND transporter periplasmic adaptor subunit [Holophaga foetida]|uniref:efflux RND transporter periplasmic adaptor subunit n=1 Tax=Holophaga foetida TaxID=35839 RepID=UPI0002473AF8|nr:efflux RND transporter periplasmic adaptor subunit [Holophaga foetida]
MGDFASDPYYRTIKAQSARWMAVVCLVATAGAALGCKTTPPPRPLSEVSFQVIAPERTVLTTELPGRTSAFLVAEIRPQVNGIIQKRLFQEGSDVKAGSTLYQIDPAPYQAALDQAQAALSIAEAALPTARSRAERSKKLVAIHAVGQQEADEAEAAHQQAIANVAAAKAAVDSARINLSHTPIKAPISGRTGMSSVTVGALVTAYQATALATVQQLDTIYVDVTQSSSDLLRLRKNLESGRIKSGSGERKAKLILEDGTTYPLEGKLQFRDVTVDPATGAITLRMVFPNPKRILLPGMFVRAVIEEGISDQAILAMQQGVTRDLKGNPIAMVLNASNQVEQRVLTVDRTIGNKWLVTSGLQPGDRLIVEGLQKIRPGITVKAVPFQASAAGK